jgi:hypothetical protein
MPTPHSPRDALQLSPIRSKLLPCNKTRQRSMMPTPQTPSWHTITLADASGNDPVTVTAAVARVARKQENGVYGAMVGLEAVLYLTFPGEERPHSYHLSRLVGEPYWVQDAHFGPTSVPFFCHGFGARYTKLRGVAPELEALLDQAARQQGLIEAIGPDVPLVLAAGSADGETVARHGRGDRASDAHRHG